MISRERAREIARLDALEHALGHRVLEVLRPDEISGRAPLLYNVKLDHCWIAYIENPGPPALRSSTIVVVDCEHGSILYRGSAGDEG